jgi:hypothetical protein
MSSRSLQDVPIASWQWQDPLIRFILISIIFASGYLLEACGEQPDYSTELQYLVNFGSFILAIVVGILAQATLSHMFSYIQGYFLLKKQGIPLQAIMSGNQTPSRILSACYVIFKSGTKGDKEQRNNKVYQIFSYASILIVYIASVGVGGYASSKLGTPYVFYSAPIKWVQMPAIPDESVRISINNAFLPIGTIQYSSLARWVEKTRGVNEVAFMPITWSNSRKAIEDGNLRDADGLLKWRVETELNNINMQYLSAQCDVDLNPPSCNSDQIKRGSLISVTANKENNTITWKICDLLNGTGSVKLDCSVILKEGVFPRAVIAIPDTEPRDEHLSEVLLRKNELNDLSELINELLTKMEEVFTRPSYNINNDFMITNVVGQLVNGWTCEARNVTCAQIRGSMISVQYVGALLEVAARIYPTDNKIDVNEWVGNSTSTGSLTASHKVCIGGSDPMTSIGLMMAIPLVMLIIELLPILWNKKVWWLASDIGFKHIALLRSTSQNKIDFPDSTIRPDENETIKNTVIRFNADAKGGHFGLEEV